MKGDGRHQRAPDRGIGDGAAVVLDPGEPLDVALRTFKCRCDAAGILREVKRRQRFTPPSERRWAKSHRARQRAAKAAAKHAAQRGGDES